MIQNTGTCAFDKLCFYFALYILRALYIIACQRSCASGHTHMAAARKKESPSWSSNANLAPEVLSDFVRKGKRGTDATCIPRKIATRKIVGND